MLYENLYLPVNLLTDTGHADTCQADFLLNLAAFQPTLWQPAQMTALDQGPRTSKETV